LSDAKALMVKAGFPNGIDKKTNKHLRLNLDVETKGLPEERARFSWFRKQFSKIGIQLNIVENDINRYKQKTEHGRYQMVFFGWNADYPDPENFLMLFYSKNSQSKYHGSNYTNFQNKVYDDLFEQLQHTFYQEEKDKIIHRMLNILKYQCVSVWGTFGLTLYLTQKWVDPVKYAPFTLGLMQYVNIYPKMRELARDKLNQIELLPFVVLLMIVLFIFIPFLLQWWRFQKAKPKRYHKLRS
jgi:ABC-type oligopeptide transport system substrate-binding subunit